MKAPRSVWTSALLILAVTWLNLQGAIRYRHPNPQKSPGPQATNTVAKPTEPEAGPVKFKDLADNTQFYYPADKDHKIFPWIKISATAAKSVSTPAKPQVTVNTVPAEMLVFPKKDNPTKSADKKAAKAN
jgi:hypothetical protein